jgi:hypothetical protein
MIGHFENSRAFLVSRYELEDEKDKGFLWDCFKKFRELVTPKNHYGDDLVLLWRDDFNELYNNYRKDAYHSIDELYEHRHALFCALTKMYDNYLTPLGSSVRCWKSMKHSDGTMFEDMFIVGMTIQKPDLTVEMITYHLPLNWWKKFNLKTYDFAPEWDGHTSKDVIERLLKL